MDDSERNPAPITRVQYLLTVSYWPWRYQRGYTTRNYHVTGEHEAEAQAAQRNKKANRLGVRLLRALGFKGSLLGPKIKAVSPSHERAHRSEHHTAEHHGEESQARPDS